MDSSSEPLDLGQIFAKKNKDAEEKASSNLKKRSSNKVNLQDTDDPLILSKMLNQSISRGQKQRIKRKIAKLASSEGDKSTQN